MFDYSVFDKQDILEKVFYPRRDYSACPPNAFDLSVPVDDEVVVFVRLHIQGTNLPTILLFHGNGEVIHDYDDIAQKYNERGINLAVADYRGYGNSDGAPSFCHVCEDAQAILKAIRTESVSRNLSGDLYIMGRSLGSISALELAAHDSEGIHGVIIESGFSDIAKVMKYWGLSLSEVPSQLLERFNRSCTERVAAIAVPVLILHGDQDQVVLYKEAKDLYDNLGVRSESPRE